jgi:very-short-patch-repair endonuclease
VPLGPYVVDFLAVQPRLVVELDGGQHASDPADAVRTRWLERQGYRVVRFWNNDVLSNPEGVVALISRAIAS